MNQSNDLHLPKYGLFHSVLSDLIPPPPQPRKSRIIFLGCGLKIHFPWKIACDRFHSAAALLKEACSGFPVEILHPENPYENPEELVRYLDAELGAGVDGILFFHSAYTAGEIGSSLGRWLLDHPTPLMSWAWPEPGNGGRNEANSLTCQNFLLNMWKAMGVSYCWTHQPVDSTALAYLVPFIRACHAKQAFKKAKLLHAGGSRVVAFYDGEVDELAVSKTMGCRFDRVDLEAVHQHAMKVVPDSALQKLLEAVKKDPRCHAVSVPDEQIIKTYRLGLGILDMARTHGYLGATVKSWPELFDCYGCAIDGAVSLMNDYGFCVAEEGEMNGLLSSLALQFLSDGTAVPTMMDLTIWKQELNRLGIWHCGASPTRWLRSGTSYSATRHSILENGDPQTAVGMMIEFLLELGPITVHRYMAPKAQQWYAFEGEFVESGLEYRGNYGLMRPTMPDDLGTIMGTIFSSGLDHHWSVGYGHWYQELEILNHFLGITKMESVACSKPFGLSK